MDNQTQPSFDDLIAQIGNNVKTMEQKQKEHEARVLAKQVREKEEEEKDAELDRYYATPEGKAELKEFCRKLEAKQKRKKRKSKIQALAMIAQAFYMNRFIDDVFEKETAKDVKMAIGAHIAGLSKSEALLLLAAKNACRGKRGRL